MWKKSDMADVTVAQQRQHLLAWLARHQPDDTPVVRETHVSILAFTAERVWKCKKAVRFPFIDLSTSERRLANCEREVALNRRLAADVYIGVASIQDDNGIVVDHVVEMRRLPDDRRLSFLVRDPSVGAACVGDVARVLADFHAVAPTGSEIDRSASPGALQALWERNLEELRPFAGPVLDPLTCGRAGADAARYLSGRSTLLADRIAGRRIRDGHGDLLADDVFCLTDGPRILDCLEFDDGLRFGDVLADLAFLAMDLERLGRSDLAARLLDGYRERTGDRWPTSLEHFYIAYRALVRAKVACLRVPEDANATTEAQHLLALATAHLAGTRMRLVLIGGPPATGKSTLARALSAISGWPVIRSDEVRKELAGLEPTTSAAARLDRGLYTETWTARTYAALLDRAREQLEHGTSVILDASWSAAGCRAAAKRMAAETATDLSSFVCEVASELAAERAAARSQQRSDPSDASPSLTAALTGRFAAWPEATVVDTAGPPAPIASWMLARLEHAAPEASP